MAGPHNKDPTKKFEISLSLIKCLKRWANKLPNIHNFFWIPPIEGGVPTRGVWKHRPHKLPKVRMCVCVCVCVYVCTFSVNYITFMLLLAVEKYNEYQNKIEFEIT